MVIKWHNIWLRKLSDPSNVVKVNVIFLGWLGKNVEPTRVVFLDDPLEVVNAPFVLIDFLVDRRKVELFDFFSIPVLVSYHSHLEVVQHVLHLFWAPAAVGFVWGAAECS